MKDTMNVPVYSEKTKDICPGCGGRVPELSPEHGGTVTEGMKLSIEVRRWHHDCYWKWVKEGEKA